MKKKIFTPVLFFLVSLNLFSQTYPQVAPLNPDYIQYLDDLNSGNRKSITGDGFGLGYIPSPTKMNFTSFLYSKSTITDASYDLRIAGNGGTSLVTPVKNQGSCGACWTFAAMGSIESRWKILGYGTHDLSEDNLNNCNGFDYGSCNGGNLDMTAAYLSRKSGPMSETDDPFSVTPNACPSGLFEQGYVYDICYLPTDDNTIKQALIDYGAIYTNMFYDDANYNSSDFTYYCSGSSSTNHAVLLVGWDNNKVTAGGTGAWIIKNSWGTSWGESGFFYISYNDALVNTTVGYFPSRLAYNANATIFNYDELGATLQMGYGSNTAYSLVKYVPTDNQSVLKVGTWLTASNATVNISVYDDFDGSTLSNLLGTITPQNRSLPGYYTFDLPSAINVSAGNDFYIKVEYNTPSFNSPIPLEGDVSGYATPVIETDMCWISGDGSSWLALGNGTSYVYDVCIKAYATSCDLPVSAGTISGTATVCQGQNSVTYTVPAITNATLYDWTLPSDVTGASTTNSITVNYGTSAIAGNITVKGSNTCGDGATSILAITVNPLPVGAGTITGTSAVCQGQNSVTYSVPAITNATSYVWTLPTGAIGSSTTSSITVNYGTSAVSGNITVKGNNTCGDGAVSTLAITVNPLPVGAGTITGTSTVCQGQNSVTYTVPAITNATLYDWTLPSDVTGASTTNSITVNYGTSAIAGNITVKGSNTCGDGATSILAITVNPLPVGAGTITGTSAVCQGQNSVTYSVPAITNATSYVWTLPTGAIGSSTTSSITVNYGTSAVSGDIAVKGNNSCGDGAISTLAITVNPLPDDAGTISGASSICQGQSSVTYTVPAITNATTYAWTIPIGATGTSTTNSITIDYGTSTTLDSITVKGNNTCGDGIPSTLEITAFVLPLSAGTITGTTTVCQGMDSITYTVPAITNAASYVWTLPSGVTGTSATNSITVNYGTSAVSDSIAVKGSNACGDGASSAIAITVNPVYSFIENQTICNGDIYNWQGVDYVAAGTYIASYPTINSCDSIYTLNLTVDSVDIGVTLSGMTITADSTADSYQWLDCDNNFAPIVGETNQSFTATVNGNYSVIITNGLCSDTSACIQIVTVGFAPIATKGLSIYPNPVSDELIIEIKGNKKVTDFQILNSKGQMIFKGKILEKTIVQTNSFSSGVYLIKLENGKTCEFKKVIKE